MCMCELCHVLSNVIRSELSILYNWTLQKASSVPNVERLQEKTENVSVVQGDQHLDYSDLDARESTQTYVLSHNFRQKFAVNLVLKSCVK